jgi:hypothetical protein
MNDHIPLAKQQLLIWAQNVLGSEIKNTEEIAATAYSYVCKITSSEGIYYLKKTPPKLYIEVDVIGLLNKACGFKNIPEIIARNDELQCFLMPSCGDQTLRTLFDNQFDKELFYKGVSSYVALQKASSSHTQKFLDIGAPDWRISNLHNVYEEFINDDERLAEWGLNSKDKERIARSLNIFPKLCKDMAALNLPDVLNHSDFHPNAMLLDEKSGEIKIIDLGEVTVGNPLFPLASCITNYLDHRYQIRSDKDQYAEIKTRLMKQWDLRDADVMHLIEIIGPLNYAMTFRELMNLSGYNFPKWRGFIKEAFIDFLDRLENRYK